MGCALDNNIMSALFPEWNSFACVKNVFVHQGFVLKYLWVVTLLAINFHESYMIILPITYNKYKHIINIIHYITYMMRICLMHIRTYICVIYKAKCWKLVNLDRGRIHWTVSENFLRFEIFSIHHWGEKNFCFREEVMEKNAELLIKLKFMRKWHFITVK